MRLPSRVLWRSCRPRAAADGAVSKESGGAAERQSAHATLTSRLELEAIETIARTAQGYAGSPHMAPMRAS